MRGIARYVLAAALACGAAWIFAVPASAAATPCSATASKSGEWPVYGHDLANTRSQPLERALGPAQAGSLSPAWVFSTASVGDASALQRTPGADRGCGFRRPTHAAR